MSYDLTKLDRPVIVFESDDLTFRGTKNFMQFLDQQVALGEVRHPVELGTGAGKGSVNPCFALAEADFMRLVELGTIGRFICKQEAFMLVDVYGDVYMLDRTLKGSRFGEVLNASPYALGFCEGWIMLGGRFYAAVGS